MAKKIINTLNRSLKTSDLLNHKDSTFKDSLNENLKKTISTALKANPELRADIEKLDLDAEVLKAEQSIRDHQDSTRKAAPMKVPENALVVDTSLLNFEQVVNLVEAYVKEKLKT